jgi:hypothetical protein
MASGPATIARLGAAIYPSLAMLAGMQFDVFTPLKDGPLPCASVAEAIGVNPDKLRPLEAGFGQVEVRYGAGPVGSTIIVARKQATRSG